MAWTDERVETLRKLWGDGMSASQIAKELGGVTRNAVIGKVHRLGLSSRGTAKAAAAAAASTTETPAPEPAKAAAPEVKEPAPQPTEQKKAEKPAPAPQTNNPVVQPVAEALAQTPVIPSENQVNIAEIDRTAMQLSLMDLTERTCKWPIGDPSRGDFYFCGHPALPGKPYCSGHSSAAYQPMSSRRDREKMRSSQQRPMLPRSA